jgi:hypothetical protein
VLMMLRQDNSDGDKGGDGNGGGKLTSDTVAPIHRWWSHGWRRLQYDSCRDSSEDGWQTAFRHFTTNVVVTAVVVAAVAAAVVVAAALAPAAAVLVSCCCSVIPLLQKGSEVNQLHCQASLQ